MIAPTVVAISRKNVIARVAHLKELAGEREWRVTPRQTAPWASFGTTTKVGHGPE